MKIFFTGSPRALKKLKSEHLAIFSAIEKCGGQNLSKLVIDADPDEFYEFDQQKVMEHYHETIKHLKEADIMVAEVSIHSMSMGYLVNKCLEMNKPVIVMHLEGYLPFFFSGIDNEKLQIVTYNLENVEEVVKSALSYAQENVDTRFNFFISPSLSHYLDWVSQTKKIPRSVYLRQLIEEDREKNKEYFES